MTANSSCPPHKMLVKLVAAELDVAQEAVVVAHLDQCASCRDRLDRIGTAGLAIDTAALGQPVHDTPLLRAAIDESKRHDPWATSHNDANEITSLPVDALRWTEDGYELVQIIGRGGMGVVFEARDISLNRTVAIKVLSPAFSTEPMARERFLREARAAAATKHPNIVTIHAVNDRSPLPYLVMEHVTGESLRDWLDRDEQIQPDKIVRVGRQVALGLESAHGKGVVHRDIKPGNVLIDADSGTVKLTDFGLASVAGQSRLTRSGIAVGSPAYMAPESLKHDHGHDERSDLFSLGCVLYAMSCGESPFESESLATTLHRVAEVKFTPVGHRRPNLPISLVSIITKLLQKSPNERFQTAAEVAAAFSDDTGATAIHRRSIEAELPTIDTSSTARTARKPRGRSIPKSAIPILFLLALAVVGMTFLAGRRSVDLNQGADVTPDPKQGDSATEGLERQSLLGFTESEELLFAAIDSDGNPMERYESLEDAAEGTPDSGRIEINSNGTFELTELELEQRELTIAAGKGFEPKLEFVDSEEGAACVSCESQLRLEGLQLIIPDDSDASAIVFVDGGALRAERCHFRTTDGGCCIAAEAGARLELIDCELHATNDTAIEVSMDDETEVFLTRTVVSADVGFALELLAGGSIMLDSSSLLTEFGFEFESIEEDSMELSINVNASTLTSTGALLNFHEVEMTIETMATHLRWTGRDNDYSGPFVAVEDDDGDPKVLIRDLATWQRVVR